MNSLKLFLNGRLQTPFPLAGDSYTLSSDIIASSEAKSYSCYYFMNRYSPNQAWPTVAKDSRMILYGLTDFIRTHLTKPTTRKDVNEAACFMSQAKIGGGPLPFNRNLWDRVVEENSGWMPIKIKALPEASTFFPYQPVIQVENCQEGFGELACHIEALLTGTVSIATANATLCRHYLERVIEWLKLGKDNLGQTLGVAQWFIHNFGMRASSCAEESEILSRSHLLSFKGTDTFNGAWQAKMLGCTNDTGKSILALAHRIVQSFKEEITCYNTLAKADNVGSFVGDCYNFKRSVAELLLPLAKANPNNIVVIRSDSGNKVENLEYTIQQVKEQQVPNARYLDGDGIQPEDMKELIDVCWKHGIDPKSFLATFGIGGALRNLTRDNLSSSYKLACVSTGEKGRLNYTPAVKLSEVETKGSVPGPSFIDENQIVQKGFGNDIRVWYYDGCEEKVRNKFKLPCYEQFSKLQNRCINQFNEMGKYPADFGLHTNSCLSQEIKDIQKEFYLKYKGNN